MIEIKNVYFSYGEKAVLENINFSIESGEFVSIIGPNGSGKTTLLRLITGYLQPLQGCILLNKKNIVSYSRKQLARKISVVAQTYLVNMHFTVEKLVQMGRDPYLGFFKKLNRKDRVLIEEIIEKLELSGFKHRQAKTLSGGELQRVMIAKALVQNTPVIIMDEPVNHLDVHHQVAVLKILKNYQKQGRTIITVLHDLNFAAKFSDKITVLDRRLVGHNAPQKIFNEQLLQDVFQTRDFSVSRDLRVVLK